MPDTLTLHWIIDHKFEECSSAKKIAILWEAMAEMQSYNGRSREICIAIAMGYVENCWGTWQKKD